jgi:hypothetical protein
MSGLASRSRCILCCISMKLAEPMPRFPSPGMPPKPPMPKGEAPISAGAGGKGAAAGEAAGGGEVAAPEPPPPAAAAADCLMTRWTVIPSLTLWEESVSVSFMILPAKMRQRFSTGALPNLLEIACLN